MDRKVEFEKIEDLVNRLPENYHYTRVLANYVKRNSLKNLLDLNKCIKLSKETEKNIKIITNLQICNMQ